MLDHESRCLGIFVTFFVKVCSAAVMGSLFTSIRSLYLGSVAEKRGRAIDISDLEELLNGCSQLEVRHKA